MLAWIQEGIGPIHETEVHHEGANLELNKRWSATGRKPWSGWRCSPKTGIAGTWGSSSRQLGQGCSRDAGILEISHCHFAFCRRVLWPGKIRKEPPKGQSDNPIRYYRRARRVTATWSSSGELKRTPFNTARGTICCGRTQRLGARLCTVNAKLILSLQAFFSVLCVCFCQLHLIPIWLSKVSMGWQRGLL